MLRALLFGASLFALVALAVGPGDLAPSLDQAPETALRERPQAPSLLATHAQGLYALGDLDGAIREQEAALVAAGENPSTGFGLTRDHCREAKAIQQRLLGHEGAKP